MVARQMDQQYVEMVVATLLKLAAQDKWEVRHASLMGMQHLLAARTVSTICHTRSTYHFVKLLVRESISRGHHIIMYKCMIMEFTVLAENLVHDIQLELSCVYSSSSELFGNCHALTKEDCTVAILV